MGKNRIGNEEVIEQLPASLQKLLALERYHLHKPEMFQDTSRDPAFDTRYFPQYCGAIELPCFWIPRKHLYICGSQDGRADEFDLLENSTCGGKALFPIHPTAIAHYKDFLSRVGAQSATKHGLCIWAVPTSSTRTLLAWPDHAPERALFIKTSLQSPILGDRRLSLCRVARSVGLSMLLEDSQAGLSGTLDYFKEPMGFVPRSLQNSGVIFRSIPRAIKDGRILVAPLFSLFGGCGTHAPLFLIILQRSGMKPAQFLEDVLCAPFARLWLEMSMRSGLMLEAHGQDLMLALSPDLFPLRKFFYRDCEGIQTDWELRHSRGLFAPKDLPNTWRWHETYATCGYRYGELVWYKLYISFFDYVDLVLKELELSLRAWQKRGLIPGPEFEEDDVTMIFSAHVWKAIKEMFGVRVGREYNISKSRNKFLILLLSLRRKLMVENRVASRLPG